MPLEFDPSATRAVLRAYGDHWVVAVQTASEGRWGHARKTWTDHPLSGGEVLDRSGLPVTTPGDAIESVEELLRRQGWHAVRGAEPVAPPVLESWDLSPASEYGRPRRHL